MFFLNNDMFIRVHSTSSCVCRAPLHRAWRANKASTHVLFQENNGLNPTTNKLPYICTRTFTTRNSPANHASSYFHVWKTTLSFVISHFPFRNIHHSSTCGNHGNNTGFTIASKYYLLLVFWHFTYVLSRDANEGFIKARENVFPLLYTVF